MDREREGARKEGRKAGRQAERKGLKRDGLREGGREGGWVGGSMYVDTIPAVRLVDHHHESENVCCHNITDT